MTRTAGDILHNVFSLWRLFPLVTVVLLNIFPGEALAFVDYIEVSNQPLQFVRDPGLANRAIIGIEVFPTHTTAGTLINSPASRIPVASSYLAAGVALRVMATGYSSTPDQTDGDPFTTASGTRVHPGTLAANFLPFGTKVRIGNMLYQVEDRLNPRYNGRYIVDLWFTSRAEALQFGVRVVEMEIVSLP